MRTVPLWLCSALLAMGCPTPSTPSTPGPTGPPVSTDGGRIGDDSGPLHDAGGAPPPGDGGPTAGDSGHPLRSDGGTPDDDGGTPDDDGGAPGHAWHWQPIEGSRCASGARAGLGINRSTTGDDVLIFLQGGGACWNQGTCVPSLLAHGPVCYYNPNICLVDGPGGTKPTASYVTHPDPFPADGTGAFPHELGLISGSRLFDRDDPQNPFRDANFVFVPYCTGDLHAGDAVREYSYQYDLFGTPATYTMHFSGATNMEAYLTWLKAQFPSAQRIWLTGASAGGYGATFHLARTIAQFPDADVALLADSSPFIDTALHWQTWADTWNLALPDGCAGCDAGFSAVMQHLLHTYPENRVALLAYEEDAVIRYYFHGGTGPDPVLNPPLGPYAAGISALRELYDGAANAHFFLLPGTNHVMIGGYGVVRPDGTVTEPLPSADGATDLKQFIDAWALGGAAFASTP